MTRYKEVGAVLSYLKLRPFSALREVMQKGYSFADFRCDLMAGIVVGLVAIPLGMALAIASGVSPQAGLYTVIIAGVSIAVLGGSRFQVSGPTAAFVVILAPIVHKFGLSGLLIAGLMAGILLVLMGVGRMGQLIQFIPYPVTTGFTAGIGLVIATLQVKDFLGLQIAQMPDSYVEKVIILIRSFGSISYVEFALGLSTLSILLLWPKVTKKIPAPLIALSVVTVGSVVLKKMWPELSIATIGNRFSYELNGVVGHGVPQALPAFHFPWDMAGPDGQAVGLKFSTFQALLPAAFTIAMLGAIESLLSAVVADGMADTKHDPDTELVALGTGNIICPFFGGIAATGAIARTATNIRFGAKSPISAIIHAIFTLLVLLLFAPYVSYLPMAALAALLMLVAYNMAEIKHFLHILKVAPKSDMVVLLICFSLTVLFDMVVGVSVGIMLASLLFMRRMASVASAEIWTGSQHPFKHHGELPKEIMLYNIAGPLFFGAAEKTAGTIGDINEDIRTVIFTMGDVPVMDVTGMIAFESAVEKLVKQDCRVILAEVKSRPKAMLIKSDAFKDSKAVQFVDSIDEAIRIAKGL